MLGVGWISWSDEVGKAIGSKSEASRELVVVQGGLSCLLRQPRVIGRSVKRADYGQDLNSGGEVKCGRVFQL